MWGAKQYGAGSVKSVIYRDLTKVGSLESQVFNRDGGHALTRLQQDNPLD